MPLLQRQSTNAFIAHGQEEKKEREGERGKGRKGKSEKEKKKGWLRMSSYFISKHTPTTRHPRASVKTMSNATQRENKI